MANPPHSMRDSDERRRPSALEIRNLSKTFGLACVLHNVTFDVKSGSIHAILGHNGSGKSTVIRVLAGNHRPDGNETSISVAGADLAVGSPAASHKAGLRFVHQDLAVIAPMSAIENLEMGSTKYNGSFGFLAGRSRAESRARDRLAALGLTGDFDVTKPLAACRHVDRLTVAIARAMADLEKDGVLVLDEPTAALPPQEVHTLFDLVRGFVADGGTVVYVTHRLDEILTYADAVTVLRDGVVVGTYDTADLTRRDLVAFSVGTAEHADGVQLNEQVLVGGALDVAPEVGPSVTEATTAALEVRRVESTLIGELAVTLARGEIVGIAGLAGSGREEVAGALVGAVRGADVDLSVAGRALPKTSPRRALAAGLVMVPGNRQVGSRVREMSTRENLTLPAMKRFKRGPLLSRKNEQDCTNRWVTALDVRPTNSEQVFGTLSGGNQQKVIVAKWLDTRPVAAVLDEPTAGVDAAARRSIYDQIRQAADAGVAFLVCSSDVEDLVSLCSRVLVLNGGRVSHEIAGGDVTESKVMGAVFQTDALHGPMSPTTTNDATPTSRGLAG